MVRYVTQPPTTTATTSCLSSRKCVTNNETKATPTQSPTACHNPLLSERSPTGSRLSRKHVQFPDTSTSSSQIQGERIYVLERTKNKYANLGQKKRNVASSISVYVALIHFTTRAIFIHLC